MHLSARKQSLFAVAADDLSQPFHVPADGFIRPAVFPVGHIGGEGHHYALPGHKGTPCPVRQPLLLHLSADVAAFLQVEPGKPGIIGGGCGVVPAVSVQQSVDEHPPLQVHVCQIAQPAVLKGRSGAFVQTDLMFLQKLPAVDAVPDIHIRRKGAVCIVSIGEQPARIRKGVFQQVAFPFTGRGHCIKAPFGIVKAFFSGHPAQGFIHVRLYAVVCLHDPHVFPPGYGKAQVHLVSIASYLGTDQADAAVSGGMFPEDFVCAVCGPGVYAQDFDVL